MNQYGDYPVDHSTGLVDITVPLYTIQTSGLSMPLELKFHPSGLRADEREGLFGVRWALSGLGHISRIIRGYPDENIYCPFNENVGAPNYMPNFHDLYGTTNTRFYGVGYPNYYNQFFESGFPKYENPNVSVPPGKYKDTEYDIYSYSLPNGKRGKFIYKKNETKAYPMPYEPMVISPERIVDEDGITYVFGENNVRDDNRYNQYTSWYLTSVISANKQDTIKILYEKPQVAYFNGWSQSLVLSHRIFNSDGEGGLYQGPTYWLGNLIEYTSPLRMLLGDLLTSEEFFKHNYSNYGLSVQKRSEPHVPMSIQFRSAGRLVGKVNFTYQDVPSVPASKRFLKGMIITDGNNVTVRKIDFELEKEGNDSFAFLKKVSFGENGSYNFDYYKTSSLSFSEIGKYPDWWGYYSSYGGWFRQNSFMSNYYYSDESGRIFPTNQKKRDFPGHQRSSFSNLVYPSTATKEASSSSMQHGMIRSVRYPTGGETLFEYEANNSGNRTYGGLRISKIINKPEQGKTETKSYAYNLAYIPGYLQPPTGDVYNNIYTENEIYAFSQLQDGGDGLNPGTWGNSVLFNRSFYPHFLRIIPFFAPMQSVTGKWLNFWKIIPDRN